MVYRTDLTEVGDNERHELPPAANLFDREKRFPVGETASQNYGVLHV